jgi:hypothetical protein
MRQWKRVLDVQLCNRVGDDLLNAGADSAERKEEEAKHKEEENNHDVA